MVKRLSHLNAAHIKLQMLKKGKNCDPIRIFLRVPTRTSASSVLNIHTYLTILRMTYSVFITNNRGIDKCNCKNDSYTIGRLEWDMRMKKISMNLKGSSLHSFIYCFHQYKTAKCIICSLESKWWRYSPLLNMFCMLRHETPSSWQHFGAGSVKRPKV